jgi:hypothetical protein
VEGRYDSISNIVPTFVWKEREVTQEGQSLHQACFSGVSFWRFYEGEIFLEWKSWRKSKLSTSSHKLS